MTEYKKCGSVVINGKKKSLYSKAGTTKKYVTSKGRKMNVVKYRKMMDKKAKTVKPAKSSKPKRHAKKHGGSQQGLSNMFQEIGLGNM